MDVKNLVIKMSEIIKSIPEDRYDDFINELGEQLELYEQNRINVLRDAIDGIRND